MDQSTLLAAASTSEASRLDGAASQASLEVLRSLFSEFWPRDFVVRCWDATTWAPDVGQPERYQLLLRHPGAVRRMLWPPTELAVAEAYIYGDIDLEGDIQAAFRLGDWFYDRPWGVLDRARLRWKLRALPGGGDRSRAGRGPARLKGRLHSIDRDREAVAYHYDVSSDFYRLWLGDCMVYSCAYYTSPDEDVDAAQLRKVDYVCRKVRLRSGERLLDLGCGWGTLVMHAARHYGVEALGVTISRAQAEIANERIRAAGLSDRCRVEAWDYRQIEDEAGFDKIVSVGMSEHVGTAHLPEFFGQAWRLLRPGGVFLHHAVTRHGRESETRRTDFLYRHVYPDAELVPIGTTLGVAERAGFEVRDVEDLRDHYALTCEAWLRRLEAAYEQARRLTDETTFRVWRLYLAGSAYGFRSGRIGLYQTLLAKLRQGESGLPLTRADWYA